MLFSNIEDQIKRFHATYYVYVIIYISYFHFFDYNFAVRQRKKEKYESSFRSNTPCTILVFPGWWSKTNEKFKWE